MTQEKQTALQKTISQLKQQKDILKNHFEMGKWNNDRCSEIDNCISILESNLELEKQQIEDAFDTAYSFDHNVNDPSAQQYYNKKYEI